MKSSKIQFFNQASSMITRKMILENYSPRKPKKSIHKVKVYNNSPSSYQSPITQDTSNHHETNKIKKMNEERESNENRDTTIKRPLIKKYSGEISSKSSRDQSFRKANRSRRESRSTRRSNSPKKFKRRSRSCSLRSNSPTKRTKTPTGFYFKSYYNEDADRLEREERLKTVKVKDLPNNITKEELFEFFAQVDLLPKEIKFHIDRGRRYTEAEIKFRTLQDAKKSFLLSGAVLKSQSLSRHTNSRSKHIEIVIDPELSKINVFNPSSVDYHKAKETSSVSSSTFNYHYDAQNDRNRSIDNNDDNYRKNFQKLTSIDSSSTYYSRSSDHHFLSNTELIDQLKNSIHESLYDYSKKFNYNQDCDSYYKYK